MSKEQGNNARLPAGKKNLVRMPALEELQTPNSSFSEAVNCPVREHSLLRWLNRLTLRFTGVITLSPGSGLLITRRLTTGVAGLPFSVATSPATPRLPEVAPALSEGKHKNGTNGVLGDHCLELCEILRNEAN